MASFTWVITDAVSEFLLRVEALLPRVIAAGVFLAAVYVLIRLIQAVLRRVLQRVYPAEEQLVADFGVLVVTVLLWFGAALLVLSILGLEGVAASLGTAAGFLALGVSYALSDMIADTVAGLYLLRDPDFNPGDVVTTEDVSGEVTAIGLRKSRLTLEDGDVVVLANRAVEQRWRREA